MDVKLDIFCFFDGSDSAGLGHVNRSMAFMIQASNLGHRVSGFQIMRDHIQTVDEGSYHFEDTVEKILGSTAKSILVLDIYKVPRKFKVEMERLLAAVDQSVVFETTNLPITDKTLVVNYSLEPISESLGENVLSHPSFFMSGSSLSRKGISDKASKGVALVFGHLSLTVATKFEKIILNSSEIHNFDLSVYASSNSGIVEFCGVPVIHYKDVRELKAYQFVICPPSTVFYECIALGIPSIVVGYADSHYHELPGMLRAGVIGYIGSIDDENIGDRLESAVSSISLWGRPCVDYLRRSYSIDGKGAERLIDYIVNEKHQLNAQDSESSLHRNPFEELALVECDLSDLYDFLKSRNQAHVRSLCGGGHEIDFFEHVRWWFSSQSSQQIRYKLQSSRITSAFGWIKTTPLDGQLLFTSGWFPAVGHRVGISEMFAIADYEEKRFLEVNAIWVAWVNSQNKIVLRSLLERGFERLVDPSPYSEIFRFDPSRFICFTRK